MSDEETGEWITQLEVFQRFALAAPAMRDLVRKSKVRSKTNEAGRVVYNVADLEKADRDETSAGDPVAELIRAARSLVEEFGKTAREGMIAAQAHEQKMFDKYSGALDRLLEQHAKNADAQSAHILKLEQSALEMREVQDKLFNYQHERELDVLREKRKERMQERAIEVVGKQLLPILMKKIPGGSLDGLMGAVGAAPAETQNAEGAAPAEAGPDPRLAMIGQAVVAMVATMSDEKFVELGKVIPPDEYAVLESIRAGVKGG